MKDPGYAIRKAYYTKLNGNLTLNGNNVPVYSIVPNTASAPYVVLTEQTGTDDSSKGCFGIDGTILIDIVTRFKSGGTKNDVDNISNQILQLIIDFTSLPDASPDFKIYGVILENMNYLEEVEKTNYTVRKLLRIRNLVQQL